MFDIGTPHRGTDHAAALLALHQQGHALCSELTLEEFFAPQGDAWAPAEHIRHLRKATEPITLAFRLPRWGLSLLFGRRAQPSRTYPELRATYRTVLMSHSGAGVFAPRPEPSPVDPGHRRQEILKAWEGSVLRFSAALGTWPDPHLDQVQLPHPRLGRLSLREMASFVVYHTAHHLGRVAERSTALRAAGS